MSPNIKYSFELHEIGAPSIPPPPHCPCFPTLFPFFTSSIPTPFPFNSPLHCPSISPSIPLLSLFYCHSIPPPFPPALSLHFPLFSRLFPSSIPTPFPSALSLHFPLLSPFFPYSIPTALRLHSSSIPLSIAPSIPLPSPVVATLWKAVKSGCNMPFRTLLHSFFMSFQVGHVFTPCSTFSWLTCYFVLVAHKPRLLFRCFFWMW